MLYPFTLTFYPFLMVDYTLKLQENPNKKICVNGLCLLRVGHRGTNKNS